MVYGLFVPCVVVSHRVLHHEEEEHRCRLSHGPTTECHSAVRSCLHRDALLSTRLLGYVEAFFGAGPLAPRRLYYPAVLPPRKP